MGLGTVLVSCYLVLKFLYVPFSFEMGISTLELNPKLNVIFLNDLGLSNTNIVRLNLLNFSKSNGTN